MSVDTMNADLATLRQGLKARQRGTGSTKNTLPALAALDRVEAELARLREERDAVVTPRRLKLAQRIVAVRRRAEAAEAELSRLREERDEARNLHDDAVMDRAAFLIRAEAAEARLVEAHGECERLRQALEPVFRQYDDMARHYGDEPEDWWPQLFNAREALAASAEGPDTPADSPDPREGIVMVYDWRHRYLGCMGIERWQEVLAADSQGGK